MLNKRIWISLIAFFSAPLANGKVSCDDIHLYHLLQGPRAEIVERVAGEPPAPLVAPSKILTEAKQVLGELRAIARPDHLGEQRGHALPETLEAFNQLAMKRQMDAGVIIPDFTHVGRHREAAKSWGPELAPKMLQDLLPEGVGYISHTLYGNTTAGVVKADSTGAFISLRVTIPMKRENGEVIQVATNVGVNVHALMSNAGKPPHERFLVPVEAEAVLISEHGGGTKGTGHHVDIEKQNYFSNYRIPVISVDAAFHAEGPTNLATRREEEEFLTLLIERYVPRRILDQKRLFYVGHSYGGQKALMLMQRTDDPTFRLGKYLGMIFPLSPVADPAPGAGPREKERIAAEIHKKVRAEMADKVAPGDLELERTLVAADKLSMVSMMGYLTTSLSYNWKAPEHQGQNYVPTMLVMGKSDGLVYVGYESRFTELANLKNMIYLLMGRRADFKGVETGTGHIVQDNRKPSELPPEYAAHPKLSEWYERLQASEVEVYGLMRVAIEDSIGKKLEPLPRLDTEIGLISQVAAAWANNRAFREFARNFTLYKYQALPGGERLQKLNKLAGEVRKDLEKLRKNKGLTEADKVPLIEAKLQAAAPEFAKIDANLKVTTLEQLDRLYEDSFAKMRHKAIPEGPMKEAAVENVRLREELDLERREATERKAELLSLLRGGQAKRFKEEQINHLRNLADREVLNDKGQVLGLMDIKREVDNHVRASLERVEKTGEDQRFSEPYHQARASLQEAFQKAQKQDKETMDLLSDYVFSLHEKNEVTIENLENMPPSVRDAMDTYHKLAMELRERQLEFSRMLEAEGPHGGLGSELRMLLQKQNKVRAEVELLQRKISDLEYVAHKATVEAHRLAKDYLESLVPGNFQVSVTRLHDVLELDFTQWPQYKWVIEPAWSRWTTLWGERPPPEKIDLY